MFKVPRNKNVVFAVAGSVVGMILGTIITIWATPYIIGFVWSISK